MLNGDGFSALQLAPLSVVSLFTNRSCFMVRDPPWRGAAWIQAHQGFATPYDRELCHNIISIISNRDRKGSAYHWNTRQSLLTTHVPATVRISPRYRGLIQGEGRKVPADPLPLLEGYRTCKATSPIALLEGFWLWYLGPPLSAEAQRVHCRPAQAPEGTSALRERCTVSNRASPNEGFVSFTSRTNQ